MIRHYLFFLLFVCFFFVINIYIYIYIFFVNREFDKVFFVFRDFQFGDLPKAHKDCESIK